MKGEQVCDHIHEHLSSITLAKLITFETITHSSCMLNLYEIMLSFGNTVLKSTELQQQIQYIPVDKMIQLKWFEYSERITSTFISRYHNIMLYPSLTSNLVAAHNITEKHIIDFDAMLVAATDLKGNWWKICMKYLLDLDTANTL